MENQPKGLNPQNIFLAKSLEFTIMITIQFLCARGISTNVPTT